MYVDSVEHAQSDQHMVILGVVNRRGGCNRTICSARGECLALRRRKKTVGESNVDPKMKPYN